MALVSIGVSSIAQVVLRLVERTTGLPGIGSARAHGCQSGKPYVSLGDWVRLAAEVSPRCPGFAESRRRC